MSLGPYSTLAEFYDRCAELFEPGGPGRIEAHLTDAEIVQLLRVTTRGYEKTGALFVIPTPAGIVAVHALADRRGAILEHSPGVDCAHELREGRHSRGWPGGRRIPRHLARRAPAAVGDGIVAA